MQHKGFLATGFQIANSCQHSGNQVFFWISFGRLDIFSELCASFSSYVYILRNFSRTVVCGTSSEDFQNVCTYNSVISFTFSNISGMIGCIITRKLAPYNSISIQDLWTRLEDCRYLQKRTITRDQVWRIRWHMSMCEKIVI